MSLILDPSWTPELSSTDLYRERLLVIALFVHAIAYGAVATLSVMCLSYLYSTMNSSNKRSKIFWMVIVGFLFSCATVYASSFAVMCQLAFSTYRNFPGGPGTFSFPVQCELETDCLYSEILLYLLRFPNQCGWNRFLRIC
jgi:hypothetical protein